MFANVVRKSARLLGSSVLATALIAVMLVYSAVATFVPQGGPQDPGVMTWSAANPILGIATRLLGMHHAFTSFVFLACAALLSISAVFCSWQRTKAAISRAGALRQAAAVDAQTLAESHDLSVPYDPQLSAEEVFDRTIDELGGLGIRVRRDGTMLRALSPVWSVWGSPVFHWALVALMLTIVIAGLQRSDGRMGLAVGELKPHAPTSYGYLASGSLHSWEPVRRQFRLDRFEPSFETGGLDYGPTPTLSLLDADGEVVKTQRIYPNNPMKSGSLTVHSDDYGLAVHLTVLDAGGAERAKGIQYVDFATDDPAGTRPLGGVVLRADDGSAAAQVQVTVPLDTVDGEIEYWMPSVPTARLLALSADGAVIEDRAIAPGETLDLAFGEDLRVDAIDWYYRFSVVDDATTPVLYFFLGVGFLGLTVTLIARQQVIIATAIETADGPRLALKVRLWRNVPVEREALAACLTDRLKSKQEGSNA